MTLTLHHVHAHDVIVFNSNSKGIRGMVIQSDVDKLNAGDCSFVDNRVMKNYADEVTDKTDGKTRCMELLDLPAGENTAQHNGPP